MDIPDVWVQAASDPRAVAKLLVPLARTKSASELCGAIAERAFKAGIRDHGSSTTLIVLFEESPGLPHYYPMMELSPPKDSSSEVSFVLPSDYRLFSELTDQLLLAHTAKGPLGDLRTGVAVSAPMELLFGEKESTDATENMLGEEYLGDAITNPTDFGWTEEHLALNQPGDFLAVGDDCNSNFYVLHRKVLNRVAEPAVLPWFHDWPGGYEQRFVSFASQQTGFGDWLISRIHSFITHRDFYDLIS